MKTIFLSYARHDRDSAKKLYDILTAASAGKVWFDEVDLIPGMRWDPAIRKAIRGAKYFVALLSKKSSSTNGYRHSELRQAIEMMQRMPEDSTFVVPARLDECKPPVDFLNELHRADLFPDWNAGVANLARALRLKFEEASMTATKPAKKVASKAISGKKLANKKAVLGKTAADYHYQVTVASMDGKDQSLATVLAGLNDVQTFAFFTQVQLKPSQKAKVVEGGQPQLYVDKLSTSFYSQIAPLETDHVIALTDRFLMFEEQDSIYWNYYLLTSPTDPRVTFCSTRNMDFHATNAGISLEVAFAHLIVSDFASYFLDLNFHKQTRGCPLDFTEDHSDREKGFRSGKFCKGCMKHFGKNPKLRDAMMAMLAWGR